MHGRDVAYWHEPSVPPTARAGPEVGVELPMLPAGHRLSAMEGRPSAARLVSSRQPVTLAVKTPKTAAATQ